MLDGIAFWTDDKIWAGILSDLGAVLTVTPADAGAALADLIFGAPGKKLTAPELKSYVIAEIDRQRFDIINKVFGAPANLSPMQAKIIVGLYRAGTNGLTAGDLRRMMGYSEDTNTHAADTAIYALRKTFGGDFIVSKEGRYKLQVEERTGQSEGRS